MLAVCAVAVISGYGVLVWKIGPTVFPGRFERSIQAPTVAVTVGIAELRAVEAILETVQAAVSAGELSKARTVLVAAVKQFPGDQTLRLALGDLYLNLSRPEDELKKSEKLTDEQREFVRLSYAEYQSALAIGPRTPEIEFTAGNLARELEDLESAALHFAAAMAGDRTVAAYPLHLAQVHLKKQEFENAKAMLVMSIALDADQAVAWGMMAEIALTQGSPRIALEQIARAIALDGRESAYPIIQARAHNRLMEPAEAIRALAGLSRDVRHSGTVLRLAGQSYGLMRQPEQALALYEEALAGGAGGDFQIVYEAAEWAERAGNTARAMQLARQGSMAGHQASERLYARLRSAEDRPERIP